LDFEIVR